MEDQGSGVGEVEVDVLMEDSVPFLECITTGLSQEA
jgi:hypothetical protein